MWLEAILNRIENFLPIHSFTVYIKIHFVFNYSHKSIHKAQLHRNDRFMTLNDADLCEVYVPSLSEIFLSSRLTETEE